MKKAAEKPPKKSGEKSTKKDTGKKNKGAKKAGKKSADPSKKDASTAEQQVAPKRPGKTGGSKKKALNAKKAVLKGLHAHQKRKVFHKPKFTKPKTLKLPRNPKYPRSDPSKGCRCVVL